MEFAHQNGDSFTYSIRIDKDGPGRGVILIHHDIETRFKNIGTAAEYVNDDVNHANFIFMDSTRTPTTGEPLMEEDEDIKQLDPPTSNAETTPDQPDPATTTERPKSRVTPADNDNDASLDNTPITGKHLDPSINMTRIIQQSKTTSISYLGRNLHQRDDSEVSTNDG
jgi:hypothetical protein